MPTAGRMLHRSWARAALISSRPLFASDAQEGEVVASKILFNLAHGNSN